MNPDVPADARIEVKFVTRVHQIQRLRSWLKMHQEGFYQPYPDRRVNNVYFDTADYGCYSDNLSGASSRVKLRYRWYGESAYPDAGSVELKIKRNYFGWKRKLAVPESPYFDGARWSDIRANIEKYADAAWRLQLRSRPFPTMLNRYAREYFVSRDNRIRFTIDYDQVVMDQRYKPFPDIFRVVNTPGTAILECKFDRGDRDLASRVLQSLPIRVGRNSKYALALKSMYGT